MFGELVRAYRRRMGLTQEELAETTGVNVRTVGKLEANQISNPRPSTVRLLADAFHLSGPARDEFLATSADPSSARAAPTLTVAADVPGQLPAEAPGFVGRTRTLEELTALTGSGMVTLISGTAGVGKTALAVRWARLARDRFPDGQLYLNLRGYSGGRPVEPGEALGRFLRGLGVPAEKIPAEVDEAAALYRSVLATRRVLVVLDNASRIGQLRALLPGNPACVTLITSRDRLDTLVALDGARRLDLDVLPLADSIALLSQLVGESRVRAEPTVAAELAAACGFLPLALRLTAAQLSGRPRRRFSEHVAALRGDGLAALALDGDPAASVAGALDQSYSMLPADAARLLLLLGLSPAPELGRQAIAAMAGCGEDELVPLLAVLQAAHLVIEVAPGRFGLHDLVRLYAAGRAGAEESPAYRREALERLLDWYAEAVIAGNRLLSAFWSRPTWTPRYLPVASPEFGSDAEALEWFAREHAPLNALIRSAVDAGVTRVVWPLVQGQFQYLMRSHRAGTLVELSRLGFEVAGEDEFEARAAHAQSLGVGYSLLRQLPAAIEWYEQALSYNEKLADVGRVARTHVNLGAAYSEVNQLDEAVGHLLAALEISRAITDRAVEGTTLGNLGWVYELMEAWDLAAATQHESLELWRELGDRNEESIAQGNLGAVYVKQGRYAEASAHLTAALTLSEELGNQLVAARVRLSLGDARQALGATADARAQWQSALDTFLDLDHPEAADAQSRLRGD